MKKIIYACLMLLLCIATFTACNDTQPRSETSPELEIVLDELGDDLDSLMFHLDGITYTLPIHFSELEERGWAIFHEGDESSTLAPYRSRTGVALRNGNRRLSASFFNFTEYTLPLGESYIFRLYSFETQIIFPGNIKRGSTYEDVIAAYGEPDRRGERALRYYGENAYTRIMIDAETDRVTSLSLGMNDTVIAHMARERYLASARNGAQNVGLEPAPEGLSDDIFSGMFSLNGVVHTLPIPFAELEADGWELYQGEVALAAQTLEPGGQTSRSTLLRRGEQVIAVFFFNFSEEILPLNESYIISVGAGRSLSTETQFVFPGNLKIGSTYEDVIAAHGEPGARGAEVDNGLTLPLIYSGDEARAWIQICLVTNRVHFVTITLPR